MDAYLRTMGVPEMAIEAARKGEAEVPTRHAIELTATTYRITRKSRMNDYTESFVLGKSTEVAVRRGFKKVKVEVDATSRATPLVRPAAAAAAAATPTARPARDPERARPRDGGYETRSAAGDRRDAPSRPPTSRAP